MKSKALLLILMILLVAFANAQAPFYSRPYLSGQKLPAALQTRDEIIRRIHDKKGTNLPDATPDPYGMPQTKDDGYIAVGLPAFTKGDVSRTHDNKSNIDYLDRSFAGKGWTTTTFSIGNFSDEGSVQSRYVQALAQNDGRYIVAFDISGSTILVRGLPNGTLDKTFGTNGFSTPLNMETWAAVLQSDGKILVAGQVYGNSWDFALARYNPDGTIDSSFNENGMASTDFGSWDGPLAIAVQDNGKIVLAGYTFNTNTYFSDFALARYNTNGTLDKSFGKDGKVTSDFGPNDNALSIAIQRNGKIVVSGNSQDTITHYSNFTLARYNINGTLDKSFGEDGKLTTDFGSFSSASGVALQCDGKIVAAGSAYDTTAGYNNFALARYTPDGSLDKNFGKNGKLTTDFGVSVYGSSLGLQRDGKLIVQGSTFDLSTNHFNDFALARYNQDGSLDKSFNKDGKLTTTFGGYEFAKSMVIQGNGNIVVAGQTLDTTINNYDFALARYKPDGSLDNNFGGDGKLTGYYPTPTGSYNSIALQSDGKIVAAGFSINPQTHFSDFALARYHTDGTLDSSFDSDGKLTTDFDGDAFAASIAIQQNGKIVVTGTTFSFDVNDIAIARYNTTGSLDKSFGDKGKLITDLGGTLYATSSIWHKGNLYVAGIYDAYAGIYGSWGSKGLVAVYQTRLVNEASNLLAPEAISTGMQAAKQDASFNAKLSPNPAHSAVTLQLKGNVKEVAIVIADLSGKIVRKGTYNNPSTITLPTGKLSAGIYTITIMSGKESKTIKLVKQ